MSLWRANRDQLEQAWLQILVRLQMKPRLLRCFDGSSIVERSILLCLIESDRRELVGRIAGVVDRARRRIRVER